MAKTNTTLVALLAFLSGFCASEYLARTKLPAKAQNTQVIARPSAAQVSGVPSLDASVPATIISTQAASEPAAFSWDNVRQLMDSGRYPEAEAQLKNIAASHKESAQAWYLLAQLYRKQNQPQKSVEAWFTFLSLERDSSKREVALRELKNYLLSLQSTPATYNDDYAWLMAQLDELAKYINSDGNLHLVMASLALKLNDKYQAQYHALMAANDPVSQKSAEEILAKLEGKNNPEDLTIPLTRFGNQFLISVNIEGYPAQLLLDTGASISGLTNSFTAKYPTLVKATRPIRLNTASGSHDSILFTVSNISIASLGFNQHILAQLPMDSTAGFDGLLGVDILGRFDFVIDQDNALLKLKARKR